MSDRISLIARLGALMESSNGDAKDVLRQALTQIVADSAVVERTEQRKEKDRKRKHSTESAETVESTEVVEIQTGSPSPRPSLLPPTPPNNSSLPPNPSKPARPRGKPAPWLPRFAAVWEKACGGDMPTERSVRALRRMVEMYGEDESVRRWGNYLAVTAPGFASAERFASTWAAWDTTPVHSTIAVTNAADEAAWDCALEVVKRLTRRELTTAEQWEEVPANVRRGLKAAGGWQAIRDARTEDIPFRKRDFLKAAGSA